MTAAGRHAIVVVAVIAVAATTARLGWWQLDRAEQKDRIEATQRARRAMPALSATELAADAGAVVVQNERMARVAGRWLPQFTVYLDNRQMNGRPGFYAVTPLALDDGTAVLVQRGWLPRDNDVRTRITTPPLPAGRVEVHGRIAPGPSRLYEFSGAASGPIRQNLAIPSYASETGLALRPLTLVQEGGFPPPGDGLLRQWPRPAADLHKHYGYAFQWFSLSALTLGLYVWYQLVRPARLRRQRAP